MSISREAYEKASTLTFSCLSDIQLEEFFIMHCKLLRAYLRNIEYNYGFEKDFFQRAADRVTEIQIAVALCLKKRAEVLGETQDYFIFDQPIKNAEEAIKWFKNCGFSKYTIIDWDKFIESENKKREIINEKNN
jgi:hypothetical protein